MQIIFWSSVFLIIYPYSAYIGLLWLLARTRQHLPNMGNALSHPKVSLIISAYNEDAAIDRKLSNSLNLVYPKDCLEIVVVSDGSTDNTCEVVSRYAGDGVILQHYEGRIGKTACLNKAVPLASGEIILFSDANAVYSPNTIEKLVAQFDNPRVGFVTGATRYVASSSEGKAESVVESMSLYAKIQYKIKALESIVSSCIGADGAVFAIRKSYYEELDREDINDLVLPLKILKRGAVGKLAPGVVCAEEAFGTPQAQFRRQVRIANRTIRALMKNSSLINPIKYGLVAFQLLSGKILRIICPMLLLLLLLANSFLLRQHWFYAVSFAAQLIVYCAVWLLSKGVSLWGFLRVFSFIHTFVFVNMAIGAGWIQYLKGETYTTWAPVRQ